MSFNYDTFDVANEAIKQEETFILSAFNDSYKYTELQALSIKLRELILMEKGTNPAALGMGVGIRNYLFEFMDDTSLYQLTEEVTAQQRLYLPSSLIKSFKFVRNKKGDPDRNKLFLFIYLNKTPDNTLDYFALSLKPSTFNTSTVGSDIYM